MYFSEPALPSPVAYEMHDHGQRSRQLAVQRDPIETRRRSQCLEASRNMLGRVGMHRSATTRVTGLSVH
ncbi:hypothetical protein ASD51_09520 [Streptomyces sp. Root55]|nr:hypothetical protein ASD51_09520 [Streptomyces sp. Root55]